MASKQVDLGWMRVLDAAVRRGSLTAAAQALGTTQPAVSYQIRRIEQQLGFEILHRRNTGVELTEQGRVLYEIVVRAVKGIDDLAAVNRSGTRPSVTLRTDYAFSALWLMPRMPEFRRRHPDVEIQVVATQRHQPDDVSDPDVSVIFGRAQDFGVPQPIIREQVRAVCSPQLTGRSYRLTDAAGLARVKLIHLDAARPAPWLDWAGYLALADSGAPPPKPEISFNTYSLVVEAAIGGQGVALGWTGLIDGYLETGLLQPVGPVVERRDRGYLLLPPKRTTPGNRALVEWLNGQTLP